MVSKSKHAGTAGRVSLTVLIPAESLVELGFAKRPRLFVRKLLASRTFGCGGCGAAGHNQRRQGQWKENARRSEREHVNLSRGRGLGIVVDNGIGQKPKALLVLQRHVLTVNEMSYQARRRK